MTSVFKIDVTEIAPEFSSRPVGKMAREKLLDLLQEHDSIEVDFQDKSLTPSFADECVGQLAAVLGLPEFKRRVALTHVSDESRPLIRHVVLTRCGSSRNVPPPPSVPRH